MSGGTGDSPSLSFKEELRCDEPSSSTQENVVKFLLHSTQEMRSGNSLGICPKQNDYLEKYQDHLILVTNQESAKDILYLLEHTLLCKFMGLKVFVSFLESWVRNNWSL